MITIPAPGSILEITWLLIGISFARGFGKKLDQGIQASDWFKKLPGWQSAFLSRLLDCLHHFWMGLLLMTYAALVPFSNEIFWFGTGLFLDDLPDVPARFKNLFQYLGGPPE